MNTEHSKYSEIVESFLDGTLSQEQREFFNNELENNIELLRELNFQKNLAKHWRKAKQLDEIKNEISNVLRTQKRAKRKRLLIVSLAAMLTGLVFIPTAIWLNRYQTNSKNLVKVKDELFYPQMQDFDQKANQYQYVKPELLFPKEGYVLNNTDTLIFKWKPALTQKTFLTIFIEDEENILKRIQIFKDDSILSIDISEFTEGKYRWLIEGYNLTESFIIK